MLRKAKPRQGKTLSARKQRFYDFLKNNPVGVLSTVTPNGEPHGAVIYFEIDQHFVVSFITRTETKKHDNLKRNNKIALTVFDPTTQTVVQMAGVAEAITSSYEVNGVAQAILQASLKTGSNGLPPVAKLEAGPFVGYKVVPKQARMAVYAQSGSGEYNDLFDILECFDLEE